jgi:pyridoxamine 5'-phosphate oxidase
MTDLENLRVEYGRVGLSEADVDADPIAQFARWFDEARASGIREPNAMTLATATRDGAPSARVVLLKGFDARGFVFFTSYESDKGRALADNARAALVFAWLDLERQIRIEGDVARVTREETEAYFRTRPRGSQIAACASAQSRPLASRAALEARVVELTALYDGRDVPAPASWGGFRVAPSRIELWQGRPSRLHDRISYSRDAPASAWRIQRLAP